MNEIERVAQMVADGRITAEEGDRLIAVLRSIQEAEGSLGPEQSSSVSNGAGSVGAPAAPRAPLPPVEPTPGPFAPPPAAPAQRSELPGAGAPHGGPTSGAATGGAEGPAGCAPTGTRWVRVDRFAGDLVVSVDPGLSAPRGGSEHGEVSFVETDEGFRLSTTKGTGRLGAWLANIRRGTLELAVPSGYGVELAKAAGDIELRGVPYLKGSLAAGDVEARGLKGVDFETLAGDVSLALELSEGRHRVHSKTGDVSVVLLPGSDVKVEGEAAFGSVAAGAPFATTRDLVGERLSGTLGSGKATLDLNVKVGSIEVRSGDGHD